MKRFRSLVLGILACLAAADGLGADWPQYRYDAGRTAASPARLPATLHLEWVRQLPPPRPAFRGEVRLAFDASYEPVVLGQTMFVPSMVTDSVTALETRTGAQRWQFFTEGPVRFAPVAWQDKVYFVSDDGHLYCVDAAKGRLKWKFQGLPPGKKDRKLLGGGRLISLWPARGGPVLQDGVLYFAAGIWSTYGVSIHALDAGSGRVIWSNTNSNHIPKANMDHLTAHYAGLTPQGYLAVVHEKLVVPCGPQLPAFLDLKTGALGTYSMGWGGRNGLPKGTWFVAGAGKYLSHGGDLYDISRPNDERFPRPPRGPDFKGMLYAGGFTRLRVDPTNQKDLGAFGEPIFASGVMYDNHQGVVAYDLADAKIEERSESELSKSQPDDPWPDKWKATFRELWRLPSKLKVHIKAGEHLYLGGAGVVEAVRTGQRGEPPEVVWRAGVEGTPHRMLAADGRLFVVTREGTIYAFGAQQKAVPVVHPRPTAPSPPEDAWTKTAADILQTTKVRDGYALVLGVGTGRLVEELVRQSRLDVIAVDRDADKAAALRQRLYRAGLYGTRASVHVGDPLTYPLPPYSASLIVSENWAAPRGYPGAPTGPAFVEAVFRPLRPYGGTACLATAPAERDALIREVAESRIPGATARRVGDWVLVSRAGPLAGSADWSHEEADAANTGASEEQFVKVPLELLWFDAPPRWLKAPGSTLVRVCDGRMLIKAEKLHAVDVYSGRPLWETSLPFPYNVNHQVVALEDAIYVAGGKTCLVLDPATGRKTAQIELPADLKGPWSNLRVWQDYLVGQSGRHVVCVRRRSGQRVWSHECGRANLSLAVGGGKVFCAELASPPWPQTAGQAPKTHVLDIETGKLLWQTRGGSEVRYSRSCDLVVLWSGIYRAQDGSLVAAFPSPSNAGKKTPPEDLPRPLFVIGRKVLVGNAESFIEYDLLTGKPTGKPMTWIRRGCTIPRASSNMVTTRFRGNAACIDLASRDILSFWNVRAACSNNLFPADGVLNMPSLTGGCTCNYLPVSQAYIPASVVRRGAHP
jgi:outer membrane protein assembly factor BamB